VDVETLGGERGNVQNIRWVKGCTISLQAAVHLGHMLRALITKKNPSYTISALAESPSKSSGINELFFR
jgi:hypothetical protein